MLKPRAEIEGGEKSGKAKQRVVSPKFNRTQAQVLTVLGGEAYTKLKSLEERGIRSGKEYKKAERASKNELRKNTAKAFGVKDKKAYSKAEQKKNFNAAMELATKKGRGGLGRDGRAQMKATLIASGQAERIFGKKNAEKLRKTITRTDKGGGKVRKTDKRAYVVTIPTTEVRVGKGGKKTTKTYKAGMQTIKYFDSDAKAPKGAVRQYVAQKTGAIKGQSKPRLGEDGYKGAKNKAKKGQSFQKNTKAETKKPKRQAEGKAKPKKEAPSKVKKEEAPKKPLPSKEQIQRAVQKATGGQPAKQTPAKPQTPATPKPATPRPTTTNKPAPAPAPKKAPAFQQVPKAGSKTPERKAFLEKQVGEFNQLNARVKKDGIQSLSRDERQTLGIGQRLNADRLKEIKSIKTPKKKK